VRGFDSDALPHSGRGALKTYYLEFEVAGFILKFGIISGRSVD
jgi:hypothetical protein